MTALGISWSWIAVAASSVGAALLALSFLRPRNRERVVPSIMLWLGDAASSRRRVLWRRLSCPLSLLAAALAAFFMLLSLAEPVWEPPFSAPPQRRVAVASPEAFAEARKFAARLDPLRTALVRAEGGGEVVSDFGSPTRLCRSGDGSGQAPDWHEVSVLAQKLAGPGGIVHVFSAVPPPQLPDKAVFHRVGAPEKYDAAPPLAVFPVNADDAKRRALDELSGIAVAAAAERADLVCDMSGDWSELEKRLYASETYMAEPSGQEIEVSSVPPEAPRRRPVRLGMAFAVLALIAAAADFLLWQRGKIV